MDTKQVVGLIGLPGLVQPLEAAGLQVISGDEDFRKVVPLIREARTSFGFFPILVADTPAPGLERWLALQAEAGCEILLVHPAGAEPTITLQQGKRISLPRLLTDVVAAVGFDPDRVPATMREAFVDGSGMVQWSEEAGPVHTPAPAPGLTSTQPVAAVELEQDEFAGFTQPAEGAPDLLDGFDDTSPPATTQASQSPTQPPVQPPAHPPVEPTPAPPVDFPAATPTPPVDPPVEHAPRPPQAAGPDFPQAGFNPPPVRFDRPMAPAPQPPAVPEPPPAGPLSGDVSPTTSAGGGDFEEDPWAVPSVPTPPPVQQPPTQQPWETAPHQVAAQPPQQPAAPQPPVAAQPSWETASPQTPHHQSSGEDTSPDDLFNSATASTGVASSRPAAFGGQGGVIVCLAGRGGAGKTTKTTTTAQALALAGYKVIVVDSSTQDSQRIVIGLPEPDRTVYDAVIRNDIRAGLLTPGQIQQMRTRQPDEVGYALLAAAPKQGGVITAAHYLDLVDQARRLADWVVVDTQIIDVENVPEEQLARFPMIADFLMPLLRDRSTWVVGISDGTKDGIVGLFRALKLFKDAGALDPSRCLTVLNKITRDTPVNEQDLEKAMKQFARFIGSVGRDNRIEQAMNHGQTVTSNPVLRPVVDAVLNHITNNPQFNSHERLTQQPTPDVRTSSRSKKKGWRSFFRRTK